MTLSRRVAERLQYCPLLCYLQPGCDPHVTTSHTFEQDNPKAITER
jgi:hypothetical protein